ncbi:MAG: tetratricopeptide repeat protein [Ardenticatenaceae bacterium]
MGRLKLHLFGSFYATLDGQRLTKFRSDKVRALLAYLVLEARQPIRRTVLVELLWNGYTHRTARQSLRMALLNLRKLFSGLDELLVVTRQTIQFNLSHPDFWCDVIAFESLLAACKSHPHPSLIRCPICRESLKEAKELYQGHFLRGFVVEDSEAFEAWQQEQKNKLQQQCAELLQILTPLTPPPHNLPRQLTPFIGREAEIAKLATMVLNPDYLLFTLVGEGGIGKTRLALAVAEQIKCSFADGVCFVALGGVSPPIKGQTEIYDTLASAIGEALNLTFRGKQRPTKQLFKLLEKKEVLIILDNFEHLIEGAHFIWQILQKAHNVTVLITSRERLNLQAEYAFRVQGLPVPPPKAETPGAGRTTGQLPASVGTQEQEPLTTFPETYSSIELFAERADRTLPGFTLDEKNLPAVIQICQFVEGLPLGIELAAALVEQQSIAEIAHSLQVARLDTLSTSMADMAARHRSIRAVFEYSWQFLSEVESRLLASISVFRGGFTDEAALAVTGATPANLAALVNQSLLSQTSPQEGAPRYKIHELVQQFAGEKLLAIGTRHLVEERHTTYYLDFLAEHEQDLKRAWFIEQPLSQQRQELDNIRQAWESAARYAKLDLIEHSLRGLTLFYRMFGLFQEAETVLDRARKQIEKDVREDPVLAQLMAEQVYVLSQLSKYDLAITTAQEAIQLAQSDAVLTSKLVQAKSKLWSGWALLCQGNHQAAQKSGLHALHLYQEMNDQWSEATTLNILGISFGEQGDYEKAVLYFKGSLRIKRVLGDLRGESSALRNLGIVFHKQGNYGQAEAYYQKVWQIQYTLGQKSPHSASQATQPIEQQVGNREIASPLLVHWGLLFHYLGDHKKAATYSQLGAFISQEIGNGSYQAHALTFLGHARLALGEKEEAATTYLQALTLYEELGQPHDAVVPLAGLARISLLEGEPEQAMSYVEEILSYLSINPNLCGTHEPLYVYLTCYRILQAQSPSGQDPRAKEILQNGYRLLQERSAKISDPSIRQMFLQNVAAHREIIEEAVSRGNPLRLPS